MYSIIICSISPERLQKVSENMQNTIGTEFEIIAIDNREKKWPIAKAYNEGARMSHYPYLFFVHEDVKFHTKDWGRVIEAKLKEPDCGVIGFAGNKIKLKNYWGWNPNYKWAHAFLLQGVGDSTKFEVCFAALERPFEEVIVLDGLGMFARKDVWETHPFDEKVLTGFHCYDIDFSLQIAASGQYKNYVCCTPKVLIEHSSPGSYDQSWYEETIRMHRLKWNSFLPLRVNGFEISEKEEKRFEERCFYQFLLGLLKTNSSEKRTVLLEFLSRPFSWKHFKHCITVVGKYFFSN